MSIESLAINLIIPITMILIGSIFIDCPIVSDLPQKINDIWKGKQKIYFSTWIIIGSILAAGIILNNFIGLIVIDKVYVIASIILLLIISVPTPFIEIKIKPKTK